jgi:hypothetical protein
MDKDALWEVCEHILTGSANKVLLRRGKIALCERCATELPTERLQTVYESQLMLLIKSKDIIEE